MFYICPSPACIGETSIDYTLYKELLNRYVKNGFVNYREFKYEEKKLDQFLEQMERISPETLKSKDQFAFYINIYNAWTIKLILTGYPEISSIKDLKTGIFGSPWKRKICRINDRALSLDEIEHHILRPRFNDPRVHFAINCASKSCPRLLSVPFEGRHIDSQLDDAVHAFINDSKSNYIDGNILYVSKIFDWFSEDFNRDIISFFSKYADGDLKLELNQKKDSIRIKFLKYDWSLNGY